MNFPDDPVFRAAVGFILATAVAVAARRTRTLSTSGAIAAVVSGTITMAAGWGWGFLLIALFVSGSALTKIGEARKAALVQSIVAKGGERDGWQVAANGGVFVAAALGALSFGGGAWQLLGIGALAASAADTWSTETGTLTARAPRLIVSGRKVPAGTSGGITPEGMAGAIAGAAFIAIGARLAGWGLPAMTVVAAGFSGALADSLLGATLQSRRWCEHCEMATERDIHVCGSATSHAGGLGGFGNDGVNFAATIVGGMVALMLGRVGGLV